MRKIMLASAAMLTICSAAFAQSTVVVTDPAPTGSVVLPGEVRTYVMEQNTPSVVYDGEITVGTTLPDTIEVHTVPNADYAYTVVNERRVIVEPKTHRVIQVLE
ncbi:DUF1236 domain-containing protein [Rhizobium sophoriradicis]|uniref:DUF1236 domain-containing protein n=1 Tax=Rhizobium sophoriradicis TaxID=1535245 RepID=UPI00057F8A66|nr:DUF1236 domain-containing protein [Rhizobium sophoriradicis]AJC78772.1 hypothetical protein IE4803_CH01538 [Rhizobium etli bv. phaseoli str. IE4803]PCK87941.1 DUF1236 domain-containing protein [Rhizobium sophoriradicis]UWU35879.1 DUF1236 domain-containing protein [Rhizobium leguminosarum bv. phaseoli]